MILIPVHQLWTIPFGSRYVFTAQVAMVGHRILKLCKAAVLSKELNALEASIRKIASVSSASQIYRIAWIAVSILEGWPAHTWSEPFGPITSVDNLHHAFDDYSSYDFSHTNGSNYNSAFNQGVRTTCYQCFYWRWVNIFRAETPCLGRHASECAIDKCSKHLHARTLLNPFASSVPDDPQKLGPLPSLHLLQDIHSRIYILNRPPE